MKNENDPYLRLVSEVKPIPGMTPFDAAMRAGGPSITRTFEIVKGSKQQDFKKDREEVLARGAAVGLDEAGVCRHFMPGGLRFLGFSEGQSQDRVGVRVRGAIILKVEGATNESRGLPVFTTGPNAFSLKKANGAAEIGKIRYFQDGRCSVAFRREGDQQPLNLDLK